MFTLICHHVDEDGVLSVQGELVALTENKVSSTNFRLSNLVMVLRGLRARSARNARMAAVLVPLVGMSWVQPMSTMKPSKTFQLFPRYGLIPPMATIRRSISMVKMTVKARSAQGMKVPGTKEV